VRYKNVCGFHEVGFHQICSLKLLVLPPIERSKQECLVVIFDKSGCLRHHTFETLTWIFFGIIISLLKLSSWSDLYCAFELGPLDVLDEGFFMFSQIMMYLESTPLYKK